MSFRRLATAGLEPGLLDSHLLLVVEVSDEAVEQTSAKAVGRSRTKAVLLALIQNREKTNILVGRLGGPAPSARMMTRDPCLLSTRCPESLGFG